MIDNQDILRSRCVDFQQLINQMQLFTQAMLTT
jgi:hypothetical protein